MFVFVKQKTAYEMRISDCSSDVCSSDLDELVAKEDDLVSEQRGANFSDRRVILFAGKVDPRNFGADPGSQRRDFQTDKAVRRRDGFHGIPLRSLDRTSVV